MRRVRRVNVRRSEILGPVKDLIADHYKSDLVAAIQRSGNRIERGGLTVLLARRFGFCYGVERAIELAYATRRHFEGRRIFILGEIIHNPDVNQRLRELGIRFLDSRGSGDELSRIGEEDVVIIPAFGAPKEMLDRLQRIGCHLVDTTCGDVVSVWRRVRQYAEASFTTLIHGRARHEETLATSSRAVGATPDSGHYVVVRDLEETEIVCDAIRRGADARRFRERFEGALSPGFDPNRHLERIGLANQTTMLGRESEEVGRRIRQAMIDRYGEEELPKRFRYYETICGATQERQDATTELLDRNPDLMLIVGGYNSSNTSHLVEIAMERCPAYFVESADCLISRDEIRHYDLETRSEAVTSGWLDATRPLTVGITAGASSPSRILGGVIRRLFDVYGAPLPDE